MVFLTILGFYAGVGVESANSKIKPTVSEKVWWILGYVIVTVAFLSLFAIGISFSEPFGADSTDIDPLSMVSVNLIHSV
jgi:hypothetical protein